MDRRQAKGTKRVGQSLTQAKRRSLSMMILKAILQSYTLRDFRTNIRLPCEDRDRNRQHVHNKALKENAPCSADKNHMINK
mmetsp:Transcript_3920/g.7193  ORF Transcript_3920/g.7193 Transcript_3920/m.7193 type:complete len:81 (-) Transcript_3920:75-317(-)